MFKLIVLFRKPADLEAINDHYYKVHVPLAQKMPGMRRFEVSTITGAPIGEAPYYQLAELYFDTQEALDSAMASPERRASAKDLMSFAANLITILYGEVQERTLT